MLLSIWNREHASILISVSEVFILPTRGVEFVIGFFVLYESLESVAANDSLMFPAGPASEYYPPPSNGLQL